MSNMSMSMGRKHSGGCCNALHVLRGAVHCSTSGHPALLACHRVVQLAAGGHGAHEGTHLVVHGDRERCDQLLLAGGDWVCLHAATPGTAAMAAPPRTFIVGLPIL